MKLRTFALAVVAGGTGWLIMFSAWHLYQDHDRLHQIWNLELQRAAAIQQLPAPPPETPEEPGG